MVQLRHAGAFFLRRTFVRHLSGAPLGQLGITY
jgi:hypothetical protein